LLLLQTLEARRGFTPTSDVADELGVSERQIRRDAEALIDAGQPVELGLLEGRSAIRMRPRPTERVALNLGQRIALVSARNVFAAFEGTDLRRDLDGAVAAVAKTLEPDDRERLRALEKRIAYVPDGGVKRLSDDPDAGDGASERLDELVSGLVRSQRVQATYLSSKDRKRTGLFAPHGLSLYRHGLYFVGTWDADPELRIFAAERFLAAERVRKERFVVPTTFDVRSFFHGAFGVWVSEGPETIVLEFGPGSFEQLSQRRYHPSQELERTRRKTTIMRLRVGVTPDLVSWLLGWGDWVDVLEPESLRERVAEAHRAALGDRGWGARGARDDATRGNRRALDEEPNGGVRGATKRHRTGSGTDA